MSYFLQGLTMGLAYVAPIGLQNMFVINTAPHTFIAVPFRTVNRFSDTFTASLPADDTKINNQLTIVNI